MALIAMQPTVTFEACPNTLLGYTRMDTLPAKFMLSTGLAMTLGTRDLLLVTHQASCLVLLS